MLPTRNDITDLAVLLLEENDDLAAVRPALIATLDLLIEPEDYEAAVLAFLPPGVPAILVSQTLQLAEYGSDLVIARLVDRALAEVATPEARRTWLERNRERLQELVGNAQIRKANRQARRGARKAA